MLRFWDLGSLPMGLHWDELDAGYQGYSLLKTGKDYHGNKLPVFAHSFADYRSPIIIYSTVPTVALFGLNDWSVRLPSAMFGLITVLGVGILAYKLTKSYQIFVLSSLVLGLSPWHIQYSRQAVETSSMLALLVLGFAKNSGLVSGLATLAYSPAKLFVPLFFLVQLIKNYSRKILIGFLIMSTIASVAYLDGLFGKSGMRFSEIAIFTDPTVKDWVKEKRLEFALGAGESKQVGMTPNILNKLEFNKFNKWGTWIIQNYLSAFSPEFLFTKGDQEPRHSPAKDMIGQFHLVEVVSFVLGLSVILAGRYTLLGWWLALSPLSASLTRDGAAHAARLSVMLPAIAIIIATGWARLTKNKKLNFLYVFFYMFCFLFYVLYFFTVYRLESAVAFQYGTKEVVNFVRSKKDQYERIFLDGHNNSMLMAYLYYSGFDPDKFQKMVPLKVVNPTGDEIHGEQLDNIYTLRPMEKRWLDELNSGKLKKTLIITTADEPGMDKPLPNSLKLLKRINFPSSEPAYLFFEANDN